jgi:hypothetical protein
MAVDKLGGNQTFAAVARYRFTALKCIRSAARFKNARIRQQFINSCFAIVLLVLHSTACEEFEECDVVLLLFYVVLVRGSLNFGPCRSR